MKTDGSVYIVKGNITNRHQLKDACDSVFWQIVKPAYQSCMSLFTEQVMNAATPRQYDARWKEAKAMEAARQNALEALHAYDDALAALRERTGARS